MGGWFIFIGVDRCSDLSVAADIGVGRRSDLSVAADNAATYL